MNSFYEAEPIVQESVFVNSDLFSEDMLVVEEATFDGHEWRSRPDGLLIDLGWYPGENADGAYRMTVLRGDWEHVLESLTSRDRGEVVARIEYWLAQR